MSRRRRVRRWIAAWRRLIWLGKMLQDLHEHGFTVAVFETEGAPLQVKAVSVRRVRGAQGTVIPISRVEKLT